MILKLNGRRLVEQEIAELLDVAGYRDLAASLAGQGYRLQPVRGPRAFRDGKVSFHLSWTKIGPDGRVTLRLRAEVEATPT